MSNPDSPLPSPADLKACPSCGASSEHWRRPVYEGVSIQKVEFDHRKGDDYEGVMVVRTNTGESSVPLKAHLEGGRLEVRWPVDLSTAWPPE